jgi:hypothetical protein
MPLRPRASCRRLPPNTGPHLVVVVHIVCLVGLAADGRLQLSIDEAGQAVEDGELGAIGGAALDVVTDVIRAAAVVGSCDRGSLLKLGFGAVVDGAGAPGCSCGSRLSEGTLPFP